MAWLLDTNVCIRYLNGRSPKLLTHLHATNPTDIFVSSIVKGELYFGAALSSDPVKTRAVQQQFLNRFDSLPFDDAAADVYAIIRADLTLRGCLIGPNDLLIAAIALAQGLTLVTHNVSEFGRVPGLVVEDWES
jgi:tRNA(fMet)-specific endonuclease VapC